MWLPICLLLMVVPAFAFGAECFCRSSWSFSGATYNGCSWTPDDSKSAWCYTTAQCSGSTPSQTYAGWHWKYCTQCSAGFTGTTCGTNIDECALGKDVKCGTHGTCVDGVATYRCQCYTGWGGADCQLKLTTSTTATTTTVTVTTATTTTTATATTSTATTTTATDTTTTTNTATTTTSTKTVTSTATSTTTVTTVTTSTTSTLNATQLGSRNITIKDLWEQNSSAADLLSRGYTPDELLEGQWYTVADLTGTAVPPEMLKALAEKYSGGGGEEGTGSRAGAAVGGVVGALAAVGCLCGIAWLHQRKRRAASGPKPTGRTVVSITNMLYEAAAAQEALHCRKRGEGDSAHGAVGGGGASIADCGSSRYDNLYSRNYIIVGGADAAAAADAGNGVDGAALATRSAGSAESRMLTLRSRDNQRMSFLIPMMDEPSKSATVPRALPRTPAEYMAAAAGQRDAGGAEDGGALYSVPECNIDSGALNGEPVGSAVYAVPVADGCYAGFVQEYTVPANGQQEMYAAASTHDYSEVPGGSSSSVVGTYSVLLDQDQNDFYASTNAGAGRGIYGSSGSRSYVGGRGVAVVGKPDDGKPRQIPPPVLPSDSDDSESDADCDYHDNAVIGSGGGGDAQSRA